MPEHATGHVTGFKRIVGPVCGLEEGILLVALEHRERRPPDIGLSRPAGHPGPDLTRSRHHWCCQAASRKVLGGIAGALPRSRSPKT